MCYVVSQDHAINVLHSCVVTPHSKSPPPKFGGQSHCVSKDIMSSMVEEPDFTCLIPPLIFASKAHDMSCLLTQNKSHPGHETFPKKLTI